jgi:hypothetical protein
VQNDSLSTSFADTLQIAAVIATEAVRVQFLEKQTLRLTQLTDEHLDRSDSDGDTSTDSSATDSPTPVCQSHPFHM